MDGWIKKCCGKEEVACSAPMVLVSIEDLLAYQSSGVRPGGNDHRFLELVRDAFQVANLRTANLHTKIAACRQMRHSSLP
jgi:hypothetical protein